MLESLLELVEGLAIAVTPENILYCFIGCMVGMMVGVLPGIGPSEATALLIPLSYGLEPVTAIIMLCGIYYGGMYGGTITSVLINTPGEAASVITCMDGYPLAKTGARGRRAEGRGAGLLRGRHHLHAGSGDPLSLIHI